MKKKVIASLCCALLLTPAVVMAHAPGQTEDDHEARKQMEEKRHAEQSWDSFMKKVKSQDNDREKSGQHDADGGEHAGHHE